MGQTNDSIGTRSRFYRIGNLTLSAVLLGDAYTLGFPATPPVENSFLTVDPTGQAAWLSTDFGISVDNQGFTVFQPVHGFQKGDAIALVTGVWVKARANSENTCCRGVVSSVIDSNQFLITNYLLLDLPSHGLGATDAELFLSQDVAGALVSTPPSSGILQSVGQIVNANKILVQITTPLLVGFASAELGQPRVLSRSATWVYYTRHAQWWWRSLGSGESATGSLSFGYFRLGTTLYIPCVGGGSVNGNLKTIEIVRVSDNSVILSSTLSTRMANQSVEDPVVVPWDTSAYKGTEVYLRFNDNDPNGAWAWIGFNPHSIAVEE